ncbi:hypothetical protein [Rufibacter psychrotolerans]|uniref:hypothetical protein n=1 Tax=Rufibacter psychrotolerans TaxID=2812556 RepID=UPI0019670BD8|nr:hypothetical protein [Rufibacter sp. SYSU D00308]
MLSVNCHIRLWGLALALGGFACQQAHKPEVSAPQPETSQTAMSKGSPHRPRPAIQVPAPIAPGSVQAVLVLEKLLPPAGEGATSQTGQRAEARIVSVTGYGAGMNHALADGQKITVYFPRGVLKEGGKQMQAQDRAEVNLQAPLQEHEAYLVNSVIRLIK